MDQGIKVKFQIKGFPFIQVFLFFFFNGNCSLRLSRSTTTMQKGRRSGLKFL